MLVAEMAIKDRTKEMKILRIERNERRIVKDIVVREFPLTIVLNGAELVSLLCSPLDLDSLAVGFLFSEGVIRSRSAIKSIHVDRSKGVAWIETVRKIGIDENFTYRRLITTGCGRGTSLVRRAGNPPIKRISSDLTISSPNIFALVREFQQRSQTHRLTGGVHSAAICEKNRIVFFCEDIGRHNAIDKVIGKCLMSGTSLRNRVLITSGRVSSEIAVKAARSGIPVLISKSAPTELGIQLANELGLTLVGFARGQRMNVYSSFERICQQ